MLSSTETGKEHVQALTCVSVGRETGGHSCLFSGGLLPVFVLLCRNFLPGQSTHVTTLQDLYIISSFADCHWILFLTSLSKYSPLAMFCLRKLFLTPKS